MNYLQFVNNVLETAKSHKLVYEVGEGDIYEHLNSGDHKYPCVFLTVQNIDYNGSQMTVTGSLFYVDALLSDTSNKLQIQSTGMTTLQQIFMRLMDNYPDFDLRTGRYTPFDEKFSDLCAGVFSNFSVSFMDDICIVNDDIFEGDIPTPPTPPGPEPPTIKDYFCFTALEDSAITWSTVTTTSSDGTTSPTYDEEIHLQYSTDCKTWTDWNNARESRRVSINKGSKLYVKGVNSALSYSYNKYFVFQNFDDFSNMGSMKVSGNIMSLIYGEDFEDKTVISEKYCFSRIFRDLNSCITEVDLTLPATTLSESCYSQLFALNATVKKIKLILPAVELVKNCYTQMLFVDGEPKDIDVTILAEDTSATNCMRYMFGPNDPELDILHGTIHKKKNTVLPDNCYIPSGVTVVDID